MADIKSDLYQNQTRPGNLVNSNHKGGRVRIATAVLSLTAALAAGDKGQVVTLPSNARLLPESTIYFPAGLTGASDVNFGDANDTDALIDGDDWSGGAGSVGALDAVAATDYSKHLWEMLGYASDPYSELTLELEFVTDISGAGSVVVDLRYVID